MDITQEDAAKHDWLLRRSDHRTGTAIASSLSFNLKPVFGITYFAFFIVTVLIPAAVIYSGLLLQ